jgi:hypothetical protein
VGRQGDIEPSKPTGEPTAGSKAGRRQTSRLSIRFHASIGGAADDAQLVDPVRVLALLVIRALAARVVGIIDDLIRDAAGAPRDSVLTYVNRSRHTSAGRHVLSRGGDLSHLEDAMRTGTRWLAVVGALGALVAAGATVNAQAAVTTGRYGLKPITPGTVQPAAASTLKVGSSATQGVVAVQPQVYLVFWGSQWSKDPAGVATDAQNLFKGLFGAADNWGTILSQYCAGVPKGTVTCGSNGTHVKHPTTSPLAGVWFDKAKAAPGTASQAQLAAEAVAAAQHFGNTSQAKNVNAIYVIASATKTHPDGFPNSGFCAWHDFTGSKFGNLAYVNQPYIPDLGAGGCTTLGGSRLLSGFESTITHEYAEAVTDLWPARGWNGGQGEIADACVNQDRLITLSTGKFDVQGLWSNSANKCTTTG